MREMYSSEICRWWIRVLLNAYGNIRNWVQIGQRMCRKRMSRRANCVDYLKWKDIFSFEGFPDWLNTFIADRFGSLYLLGAECPSFSFSICEESLSLYVCHRLQFTQMFEIPCRLTLLNLIQLPLVFRVAEWQTRAIFGPRYCVRVMSAIAISNRQVSKLQKAFIVFIFDFWITKFTLPHPFILIHGINLFTNTIFPIFPFPVDFKI